jgi:hypothetical protein
MASHPSEPVPRVAKIRFPPMHDPMDECAVRILDPLGDGMRGIQPIVPKQDQSANQIARGCGQTALLQKLCQRLLQLIVRQHALSRPRAQLGQTAPSQQLLKSLQIAIACHAVKLSPGAPLFKSF